MNKNTSSSSSTTTTTKNNKRKKSFVQSKTFLASSTTTTYKRLKMCDLPLNSTTLNTVLVNMSGKDFDKYMLVNSGGPKAWKEATDTMCLSDAKKLVVMILCRSQLLVPFSAYLTMFQKEAEPAVHIYELGLGSALKQPHLDRCQPQNQYLVSLSSKSSNATTVVYPLLPTLQHNEHYFCLNKNFIKNVSAVTMKARMDPNRFTSVQLYYKKLIAAMVCARQQRWCECLAHSLSALDVYQVRFGHLHDVLCYIALSASKMSVPLEWCCNVLEEARQYHNFSIEHTWQRIVVFQSILLQEGMFALEEEVFTECINMFVHPTEFFQTFVMQHLLGKLAQVENNLAFQFVRTKFHDECEAFCDREPIFDKSFEATKRLLDKVDKLASRLEAPGMKEYFRGYYYLYNSTMHVHQHTHSRMVLSLAEIEMAILCFDLALKLMKTTETVHMDLTMIAAYFKRQPPLTLGGIDTFFAEKLLMKNTLGARDFLFRAMVVTMYWENHYQPLPLLLLANHAREMDVRVTNGYSYRSSILTACIKAQDVTFFHVKDRDIKDYPPIKDVKDHEGRRYWKREAARAVESITAALALPIVTPIVHNYLPPTAQSIICKNKLVEQVYAFGYQLSEAWTVQP
jgi:hypothetical protein